ncbi:EEF1A lysine methyltransferase 1-like [Glandiceps talaboti]
MSDSDDDVPQLPADTLAALQEFYAVQAEKEEQIKSMLAGNVVEGTGVIDEDWQLSQFWYDEETATALAKEVLSVIGETGRVACLCCPTLYQKLRELKPDTCTSILFEFDPRFEMYGENFVFYDYKSPLDFPKSVEPHSFDIVVADPPFLSEECHVKVAQTVKYLAKDKILYCTGAVMEKALEEKLGLKICKFQPKHERNLANEFRCFSNYEIGLDSQL